MNSATIVQELRNYCNALRDDGMSQGDYVEQLLVTLQQREARALWTSPAAAGGCQNPYLHDALVRIFLLAASQSSN